MASTKITYQEQGDGRFWILDAANEHNRLNEVQEAAGKPLTALVDEEAGGIIAYVLGSQATAQALADVLNAVDELDGQAIAAENLLKRIRALNALTN